MTNYKKLIVPGAVLGAALIGALGNSILSGAAANAATSTTGTNSIGSSQTVSPPIDQPNTQDPTKAFHVGSNGVKEVLLTGSTADSAKTAALAAIPGGTIERVETDAEGAAYEAHMTKSDGTHVTVKMDTNFKVTSTEDGPNRPGGPGPR